MTAVQGERGTGEQDQHAARQRHERAENHADPALLTVVEEGDRGPGEPAGQAGQGEEEGAEGEEYDCEAIEPLYDGRYEGYEG